MNAGIVLLCLALWASPGFTQAYARKQLNESPRHHEWVNIQSAGRTVYSFVAYPENQRDSLAIIVIHENRGLTDWVRSFADQMAAAGYLAIAPDLLSDYDDQHARTSDFESSDDARAALYQLDPEQITSDLLAVQEYIAGVPSANGKTAVIGFCWGGSQAFRFATNAPELSAALVFYGTPPSDEEQIRSISAPVYGFYGENDQRVNATIPKTAKLMQKYDKVYKYEIYSGAGHAFMRRGEDPEGSQENKNARDASWQRVREILSRIKM